MRNASPPLSSFPERVVEKIWKIAPYDKKVIYSTRKSSPSRITVLANGAKEVFAKKIKPDPAHNYSIEKGYLVLTTYPRSMEKLRRAAVELAARVKEAAAKLAAAEANPAFKKLIARLTKELGAPRRAAACDQKHRAFKAPSDARCAELIAEARTAGAAATLFIAPWGRELRVVAGSPTSLFALFDWQAWASGELPSVVEALNADAGLTLDYVVYNNLAWGFTLDRAPKDASRYASVLSDALYVHDSAWMTNALTAQEVRVGEIPVWKKKATWVVDPGTQDEDDD